MQKDELCVNFYTRVRNTKQNQASQVDVGNVTVNQPSISGSPIRDLRKNGKIVSLTLGFIPTTYGSGLTLFSIPAEFRPDHDVYMVGSSGMKATLQGSTGNILMDIPKANLAYYVTTTFII